MWSRPSPLIKLDDLFLAGGGYEGSAWSESSASSAALPRCGVVWSPCAILGSAAFGLEVVLITGDNAAPGSRELGLGCRERTFCNHLLFDREVGIEKSTTRWRMLLG
jgi:hypothetical protein